MSAIATARRGSRRSVVVTPASIFGSALVGWWRSDDLAALNDGDAIASWPDKSSNANTIAQATGANQPIKQTGINSLPCARFTLASHHNLFINTPSGLADAPGPLTVVLVAKMAATTGNQAIVEYAGSGNKGFTVGTNGNSLTIENFIGIGTQIGVPGSTAVRMMFYEVTSGAPKTTIDNWYQPQTVNAISYSVGSTKLAVGGSLLYNQWWFGGDLYEIIYVNRALTATERRQLARNYIGPRYTILVGSPYNAAAKLTTPTQKQTTSGGAITADGTVIEASTRYFPAQWNSKKYWMAAVPWQGNQAGENPNILCSTDNATWTAPASVTNPIVGARSAGNNADPRLVYNATDGKLYLFWMVENDVAGNQGVYVISSSDGATWSAPTHIITAGSITVTEPCVNWDGTQWVMHCIDSTSGRTVTRRTSSSLTSGWSAASNCTYTIPGSRSAWHMDVLYDSANSRWLMVASDQDTTKNLWLFSSPDGITWTCGVAPLMMRSLNGWDAASLYRPSLLPPDDVSSDYRLWYTENNSLTDSFVGYTTIPATEIP